MKTSIALGVAGLMAALGTTSANAFPRFPFFPPPPVVIGGAVAASAVVAATAPRPVYAYPQYGYPAYGAPVVQPVPQVVAPVPAYVPVPPVVVPVPGPVVFGGPRWVYPRGYRGVWHGHYGYRR